MKRIKTQVGIVGAGPAGLVLAHLLHLAGIDPVIIELRSRQYAKERVRAGILEPTTVDLLHAMGTGERLHPASTWCRCFMEQRQSVPVLIQ